MYTPGFVQLMLSMADTRKFTRNLLRGEIFSKQFAEAYEAKRSQKKPTDKQLNLGPMKAAEEKLTLHCMEFLKEPGAVRGRDEPALMAALSEELVYYVFAKTSKLSHRSDAKAAIEATNWFTRKDMAQVVERQKITEENNAQLRDIGTLAELKVLTSCGVSVLNMHITNSALGDDTKLVNDDLLDEWYQDESIPDRMKEHNEQYEAREHRKADTRNSQFEGVEALHYAGVITDLAYNILCKAVDDPPQSSSTGRPAGTFKRVVHTHAAKRLKKLSEIEARGQNMDEGLTDDDQDD